MIEDGQECFGYGFMSDHSDPNEVERQFMDNIQYLEYYCSNIGLGKKDITLAKKISALFDRLPSDCEGTITDYRDGMIREVVDFRNRTAHGKYDSPRPTSERLLALSIKLAALLSLNDTLDDSGPDAALQLSKKGSPYLLKMLALSDRPSTIGLP
ncbi:MAG: HEPN domain-containing protein [Terracidiphilus sp.]|jgi:hypothetical protein